MATELHHPAGTLATPGWPVELTPAAAGWAYSGLRVAALDAGETRTFTTVDAEAAVLPLSGSCTVRCDGREFDLAGRADVFAGPSDFAYVPREAEVTLHADAPARIALPSARCERRLEPRYVAAADVPVELRGTGTCSREVHNFCAAGVFEADRLIAVEVLTPAGNWSSYPPHKHDADRPGVESELEEIYYFEVARGGAPGGGIAYQRVYASDDRPVDVLAEVRDGDVVCIPYGWHGPSMAVPGYDLYYLNVMAGPSPERAWLICDDPAHGWIRDTWDGVPVDPRLPFGSGG